MIKIVVDSACDVPAEIVQDYGITVVPVLLQLGGETLRDGVDISRETFYQRMVEAERAPQTAAPPIGAFSEVFARLTTDGHQVLSISIAAALSGTYNAARQAAQMVDAERIICLDSRMISFPIAYLALAAAQAAAAGQPLTAIVAALETLRERCVLLVGLDTLHNLEQGGRIGRVRALLGGMLNVKPILEVHNSEVFACAQVRTSRRVAPRLVELAAERGAWEALSVLYTTDREPALQLGEQCIAAGLIPRDELQIAQVTAALGTHAGPAAIGIGGLLRA